jgi:hypothetical protein
MVIVLLVGNVRSTGCLFMERIEPEVIDRALGHDAAIEWVRPYRVGHRLHGETAGRRAGRRGRRLVRPLLSAEPGGVRVRGGTEMLVLSAPVDLTLDEGAAVVTMPHRRAAHRTVLEAVPFIDTFWFTWATFRPETRAVP